jgi:RimJ/RimL family protein N-acetyltransferase
MRQFLMTSHYSPSVPGSTPASVDVPERLAGARVTLRSFRSGDGDALWSAIEESREQLAKWQTWQHADKVPADCEARVGRIQDEFRARKQLYYAAVGTDDDRFLGWAGLEHIDWRVPAFDIGYWLRVSATGKGLATEAVGLLVDLAFNRFLAKRLAIWVDNRNERSIALARRLGFRREGTLRNERLDAAGVPQTTLVFAKVPPASSGR